MGVPQLPGEIAVGGQQVAAQQHVILQASVGTNISEGWNNTQSNAD